MGTLFTLIFVASALFLLAGRAVLDAAGGAAVRLGVWLAPLLFLMYARYYLDSVGNWLAPLIPLEVFKMAVQSGMVLIALSAGVVLIVLGRQPWREMVPEVALAAA